MTKKTTTFRKTKVIHLERSGKSNRKVVAAQLTNGTEKTINVRAELSSPPIGKRTKVNPFQFKFPIYVVYRISSCAGNKKFPSNFLERPFTHDTIRIKTTHETKGENEMIGKKEISLRQHKRNIGRNPDEALPTSDSVDIGVKVLKGYIPIKAMRRTKYGKIMEQLRSPHQSVLIPLILFEGVED